MDILKIAEDEKLYSADEARQVFGYANLSYMYKLIRLKKLKAVKLKGCWVIKGEWINDYVAKSNAK